MEIDVGGKDLVTVVRLLKGFTLDGDSKEYLEGIGVDRHGGGFESSYLVSRLMGVVTSIYYVLVLTDHVN